MNTPFDLSGKTAVVTGGGRDLGLGISNALLEAGADVVVCGRSPLPAELTARGEELGRQVHCAQLDLADSAAIAAAAEQVLSVRAGHWQRRGVPRLPRRRLRPWPGARRRRRLASQMSIPSALIMSLQPSISRTDSP
jgi:NAD(P)-dependent dehydrogenase (short-subunit alcohol dehydrogenase family)